MFCLFKSPIAFPALQPSWRLLLVGGHPAPKPGRWWPQRRQKSLWSQGSSLLWKVESMCCCASRLWRQSEREKQNWSFPPTNEQFWGNLKESTMSCWSKLASIATVTILSNWAQHEENTIEYAHYHWPRWFCYHYKCARTNRWKVNHANFFFNKICRSLFNFFFFPFGDPHLLFGQEKR